MTTKLTLDRAGRVLIPNTVRKELHLSPGDALQLNSEGEEITLRPVRTKALLKRNMAFGFIRAMPLVARSPT
jgi:AbrB family looped-hinge helix DNA binding protein